MKVDFEKWQNGFIDCFMFDDSYNVTVARHDGIVGRGRFWQAIVWDSMNNAVIGPVDLFTYREVADFIEAQRIQHES